MLEDLDERQMSFPEYRANLASVASLAIKALRCFRLLALPAILLAPLILAACSEGGLLPIGKGKKGETLIIVIDDMKRVQEVRFEGTDGRHYLISPSTRDNELIAMQLNVHNSESTRVLFTVDGEAAELRGFGLDEEYNPIDLYNLEQLLDKNVRIVDSANPTESLYVPFIAGPIDLPQGNSVIGWILFDVPEGTKFREMRWGAGDTVFLR